MGTLFVVLAVIFVASFVPLVYVLSRNYGRFRGARVVVCPETITPEAVEISAFRAAWTAAAADTQFRLTSCSRWPERKDCSQKCLAQIEEAPDGCLVRTRVAQWYQGATCSLCQAAIGEVHNVGRVPGLAGPDGRIRRWRDLSVEDLAEAFATHKPVCADCCAKAKHPPSTHKRSAA